jgi:hypothetical protein
MNIKQYNDKEIWMQIRIAPNGYKISSHGRVKLKNSITYGSLVNNRYLMVNWSYKAYLVHRLVASHFIPNENESNLQVDHKDENKQNNHYKNLQWLTNKENNTKSKGVPIIQTDLNGNLIKRFDCIIDASKKLNIDYESLHSSVFNKRKSANKYLWFTKKQFDDKIIVNEKINKYYGRYKDRTQNKPIDYSVLKIDKNTNEIIEKIESIVRYEQDSGKRGNIKLCCSDFRKKTAYGFKWKFWNKNENEE